MNSKGQLIAFELLSGLFGWVWIGGGIAAMVFAGLALFGDWSWWNVLYAAIVSGVAKWLTRGFLGNQRSEEHTSELQSLMRISYAVFCLNKKKNIVQTVDNKLTPTDT